MVITSISHAFVFVGGGRDRGRGLRGLAPHLPCPALLSKDERIRLQREGPPRSASVTLATAEPPPRAAAHTHMASSAVEPRPITPPTHPSFLHFPAPSEPHFQGTHRPPFSWIRGGVAAGATNTRWAWHEWYTHLSRRLRSHFHARACCTFIMFWEPSPCSSLTTASRRHSGVCARGGGSMRPRNGKGDQEIDTQKTSCRRGTPNDCTKPCGAGRGGLFCQMRPSRVACGPRRRPPVPSVPLPQTQKKSHHTAFLCKASSPFIPCLPPLAGARRRRLVGGRRCPG